MPGSSPRVVWSHLFGREVLSDSGEWRHECEVEYLLSLPEAKRAEILDGVPGAPDRESQGIRGIRGAAAVAALKVQIERLRLIKTKG
ncbi:hypothetical protein AB4Z40_32375 [Bosea sp. 2YAB26]|uniref:DUF7696 family protein n=2 Tax=Pseudomonadota TaxID=1224 RepID=UPI003F908010